jgi:hypothetical protein
MLTHDINDSSTEQLEFRRKKLAEVNAELEIALRGRENELLKEAAMNGKPNRRKIRQRLLITYPFVDFNQFGAGNQFTGYWGNGVD